MLSDTQQQLASLIGGVAAQDTPEGTPGVITGDGAIPTTVSGATVLTKGSAAAITIALPTVAGVTRRIISDSAFAHVVTFTGGGLRGGTAAVATATLAAQKGSGLTVTSLLPTEAAWGVVANVTATLA